MPVSSTPPSRRVSSPSARPAKPSTSPEKLPITCVPMKAASAVPSSSSIRPVSSNAVMSAWPSPSDVMSTIGDSAEPVSPTSMSCPPARVVRWMFSSGSIVVGLTKSIVLGVSREIV